MNERNIGTALGLDNLNANVNANIMLDNESMIRLFILGLGLIIINLVLNKVILKL